MRLIDADALREKMYHEAFETDSDMQKWDSGCWIRYKMFENSIDSMPTITHSRKKGTWIYGESEVGNDGYYCSQCGNFIPWIYKEFDIDFIKEFKFCPSCGADMRGDEDE